MTDTTHHGDDLNTEGKYIPKAYQFERDMDYEPADKRKDTIEFDEDANIHFVYDDMDHLIDTDEGKDVLNKMIQTFFNFQVERINILEDYSQGKNANILNGRRRAEDDKADYRVSHNWGGYISNFVTGYVISKPVTITYKGEKTEGKDDLGAVETVNELNDVDTLNYELGYDTSRYGRAFELHYRDDEGDKIAIIDPDEMFVIRDTSIEKRMIGAVHVPIYNDKMYMTIYTNAQIIKYKPCDPQSPKFEEKDERWKDNQQIEPRQKHFYGMVPIVEWWNNRFRSGDSESVLSLFDAYDSAQSDTANYMSDLNDAMLVIAGDLESAGLTVDDAIKMKRANMLLLESGIGFDGKQSNLTADYIYKQYDVAGTEAYKNRLLNDIYKLSLVPNLDDDRFYSGQSGVALQYKMIGLEQLRATKESFYTRALRRRYKLIENLHTELNEDPIETESLVFTFHQNMPQDIWAEIKNYIESGGDISQETLRENATFTTHMQEQKRLALEGISPEATDEERDFMLRDRELDEEAE